MTPFSLALESIKNFNLSDTIAQVSQAAHNLNFIPWFDFYNMDWGNVSNSIANDPGFTATTFGQYCAQYAATMTNWAYTLAAVSAIIVLLCKKNRKWFWYLFFAIVAVMSVTSVGMHTADYGEFAPGVITTKLLASFIDMTFTELMAWSGVLAFIFEFYAENKKVRNRFTLIVTIWAVLVLLLLTFEVFVQKNRPLWIGGRDAMGLPFDMGGDHGGLSLAEFGCFVTCTPLLFMLVTKFKTLPKNERGIVILLISTFAIAFVVTSIWGDNEINSIAQGNFQGHSLWHLLTAMGTFEAVIWVDTRTTNELHRKEKESLIAEQSAKVSEKAEA